MGAVGRTFLLCGGEGSRWNSYQGKPKQLAEVEGLPLLARTVAQLRRRGIDPTIIGPIDSFGGHADVVEEIIGANVLETIARLPFSDGAPTHILLGDVVFSDGAMSAILSSRSTRFLLRPNENPYTSKASGEIYALTVMPEDVDRLREHIALCLSRPKSRQKLWTVLSSMSGTIEHAEIIIDPSLAVLVDDFTDDIDFPKDHARIRRYVQRNDGPLQSLAYWLQRMMAKVKVYRRQSSNVKRLRDGRPRRGVFLTEQGL